MNRGENNLSAYISKNILTDSKFHYNIIPLYCFRNITTESHIFIYLLCDNTDCHIIIIN